MIRSGLILIIRENPWMARLVIPLEIRHLKEYSQSVSETIGAS